MNNVDTIVILSLFQCYCPDSVVLQAKQLPGTTINKIRISDACSLSMNNRHRYCSYISVTSDTLFWIIDIKHCGYWHDKHGQTNLVECLGTDPVTDGSSYQACWPVFYHHMVIEEMQWDMFSPLEVDTGTCRIMQYKHNPTWWWWWGGGRASKHIGSALDCWSIGGVIDLHQGNDSYQNPSH